MDEEIQDVVNSQKPLVGTITSKDYTDYEIGDDIGGGKTIKFIYYASPQFIIYETSTRGLAYQIGDTSPKIPHVLAEFSRSDSAARRQLRNTSKKDYYNLAATCLNGALLSLEDDPRDHFAALVKFAEERGPIEYIFGYGENFIVYLNNQPAIAYEYDEMPSCLIPVVAEFYRLQHIANCALQGVDKKEIASILGTELAAAFRSSGDAAPALHFLSSREFITNRAEAVLRSAYVRSSVLSSIIVIMLLAVSTYFLRKISGNAWLISFGALGGVAGATISIIQRGVTLTVNPFVPLPHVVFQGLVRVGLGGVFGVLLIVASRANLTLGILGNNVWSLFIFSVVAGFSERFIPDILDRIATQNGQQDGQKVKSGDKSS
jgi:hypothetical protein